jgi:hypothetical protein
MCYPENQRIFGKALMSENFGPLRWSENFGSGRSLLDENATAFSGKGLLQKICNIRQQCHLTCLLNGIGHFALIFQ